MKTFLLLILTVLCAIGEVHATSSRQHGVRGGVASVDSHRGIVTITSGDKNAPTEFVVVEKRTRVRHNGSPAALEDLPVGQPIRVYYAQEAGKTVANEITWESPKAP